MMDALGGVLALLLMAGVVAGIFYTLMNLRRAVEVVEPLYRPADVTRLALGSLLLQGPLLRGLILKRTANPFRARSPEPGLDIELVAAAAKRFDDEDQGYWWTIAGLTLALFVLNKPGILLLLWLAGIAVVSLRRRWRVRFVLAPRFTDERYDPRALRRELGLGEAPVREGVPVVCHGGGDPFAGLGVNLGGWNLAFDLNRPAPGCDNVAGQVTAHEMEAAIDGALSRLSLEGLRTEETMFVGGGEAVAAGVQADRFTRPMARAPEAAASMFRHAGHPGVRVYRAASVTDWAGELVFTFLYRCQVRGAVLTVEAAQVVLTPAASAYREIDRLRVQGFWESVRWWGAAVALVPVDLVIAFITISRRINEVLQEALFGGVAGRERREIEANPAYNYGALWSLRSHMAAGAFASYFQKVDAAQYFHAVNRQALNAVADLLRANDIDTDALETQSALIQNNTVQITAARDASLSGVAIGAGARAKGGLAAIGRGAGKGAKS
ncbi:hypothetical protein [Phenylobacterium sp.]|uniref:hypothetical protein n=1 Tax=Phenylobacterium sp. TaxID=1871053 RepID=UPI00286AB39F|nr:hypothetical protein [Phenylobacterium sp.]